MQKWTVNYEKWASNYAEIDQVGRLIETDLHKFQERQLLTLPALLSCIFLKRNLL